MLGRTISFTLATAAVAALVACSSEDSSATTSSSSSGGSSSGQSSGTTGGDLDGGGSTTSSSSSSSSSSSGGAALTPGTSTQTITAAGRQRSVIVVVPPAAATQKLPLVIALHGNGDTSTNFVGVNNLDDLAASKGFVLAAPQGITQTVMVGPQTVPGISWDAYRTVTNGNIDIPLIDAIRTQIGGSSSIDPKKIFTYGYSQGGYMSFRYAMETSALVSCGAVLAAANPLGPQLVTGAARKVPISIQIGTNDSALGQARNTKAQLEQNGFPLDYHEIAGAGHVPIPGDLRVPLDYCLGQTLP